MKRTLSFKYQGSCSDFDGCFSSQTCRQEGAQLVLLHLHLLLQVSPPLVEVTSWGLKEPVPYEDLKFKCQFDPFTDTAYNNGFEKQ